MTASDTKANALKIRADRPAMNMVPQLTSCVSFGTYALPTTQVRITNYSGRQSEDRVPEDRGHFVTQFK